VLAFCLLTTAISVSNLGRALVPVIDKCVTGVLESVGRRLGFWRSRSTQTYQREPHLCDWRGNKQMAADAHQVGVPVESDSDKARRRRPRGGVFVYVPGFVYILILYIIGRFVFPDPRAPLFDISGYQLSWVEVLLLAAAIVAMAEQVKVAKTGINNTTEVLLMGATAIVQIVLFALGAAKVSILNIFDNTEFFLLTLINLAQTAVAYQINSATLMRTISSS